MGNFKGGISGSMRVHLGARSLPRRALSPMIERIKQRLKARDCGNEWDPEFKRRVKQS